MAYKLESGKVLLPPPNHTTVGGEIAYPQTRSSESGPNSEFATNRQDDLIRMQTHIKSLLKDNNFIQAVQSGHIGLTFIKPGSGNKGNTKELTYQNIARAVREEASRQGVLFDLKSQSYLLTRSCLEELAIFPVNFTETDLERFYDEQVDKAKERGYWTDFQQLLEHPAIAILYIKPDISDGVTAIQALRGDNQFTGIIGHKKNQQDYSDPTMIGTLRSEISPGVEKTIAHTSDCPENVIRDLSMLNEILLRNINESTIYNTNPDTIYST